MTSDHRNPTSPQPVSGAADPVPESTVPDSTVPDRAVPDTDPIPPTEVAQLPFYDAAELRERWRALMGPLGFDEPTLWLVFVERGTQMIPVINQLPLPHTPNRHLLDTMMEHLGQVIAASSGLSLAALLARPGADGVTARDRGWASMITECAARHRVPLQPLFRANDIAVVALPGDAESGALDAAS
ncbi:hypothetical protein GPOL_174p01050 (plasmid) [Gordonia polyisoprenivorans VH2]|uniref:Uncharacterized protein n=1 Tax=Gordonia polyisoprenivorans (strain DSM 44266 / VH2) TaxID=1112204 RepID=H6N579_GORPV|nr:hypothetical protein [Gordonia polyisoprenivorans]AFA76124.1 hypothetical protein GPOL_174p01050 [Gordonia polyisoprenivorans VH2]